MSFDTIHAPHINVNDLEMIIVQWHVTPWQFVKKGDMICEIETTKSVQEVESECEGYIYPLVKKGDSVKVGEPLAHFFSKNDPKQLEEIKQEKNSNSDVMVTKKASKLMEEHDLSVSDFPEFSSISSETVVAKIRTLEVKDGSYDEDQAKAIMNSLKVEENSVAIYGEENQSLLALDAFLEGGKYKPLVYIRSFYKSDSFYGIPVLHNSLIKKLKEKGLKYIYICGQNAKEKQGQEKECEEIGLEMLSAIHSSAVVSKTAQLGKGIFIGAQVIIGPDVEIGNFSQILHGATIAHHSKLGRYVNISDGSHLGGNVEVGDYGFIGIGVNVNKRVTIGKNSTIVSGVTITDHVKDNDIIRLNFVTNG